MSVQTHVLISLSMSLSGFCSTCNVIPSMWSWNITFTKTRLTLGHSVLELSPPKSNEFILESKWMPVPNLKKFCQGEWDRWMGCMRGDSDFNLWPSIGWTSSSLSPSGNLCQIWHWIPEPTTDLTTKNLSGSSSPWHKCPNVQLFKICLKKMPQISGGQNEIPGEKWPYGHSSSTTHGANPYPY